MCKENKGRVLVISVDRSAWKEFADAWWVPHGLVHSILHFTEGRAGLARSHTTASVEVIPMGEGWNLWPDC